RDSLAAQPGDRAERLRHRTEQAPGAERAVLPPRLADHRTRTSFNLEHECGAGGCQGSAGDFLVHCHVQHHYLSGMRSHWRVLTPRQADLAPLPDRPPPPVAVPSTGLVGKSFAGFTVLPESQISDPGSQISLEAFIEAQLPPPGVRFNDDDATVWDWVKTQTPDGPLYLGEPETNEVWPTTARPRRASGRSSSSTPRPDATPGRCCGRIWASARRSPATATPVRPGSVSWARPIGPTGSVPTRTW